LFENIFCQDIFVRIPCKIEAFEILKIIKTETVRSGTSQSERRNVSFKDNKMKT
jgi:hypothetical protein